MSISGLKHIWWKTMKVLLFLRLIYRQSSCDRNALFLHEFHFGQSKVHHYWFLVKAFCFFAVLLKHVIDDHLNTLCPCSWFLSALTFNDIKLKKRMWSHYGFNLKATAYLVKNYVSFTYLEVDILSEFLRTWCSVLTWIVHTFHFRQSKVPRY